nr:MAG: RNA-dependent RNA polymerase [Botourmiaviridae sp.]
MTFKESLEEKLAARWVVRGNIVPRALPKTTFDALVKLEKLRGVLNASLGVRLPPVPSLTWSVPNLKGFCDGILDRDTPWHAWRSSLLQQHACRRTRVGVAASLFLFRKVLPSEMTREQKQKKLADYVNKMCSPSPPLDPSFAQFAEREVSRLFRIGWDSRWQKVRDSFVLPTSSCLENRRGAGGPRNLDREMLRECYRAFSSGTAFDLGTAMEPMIINTGGKDRLVTQFSCFRSFLKPLHTLLYDHLSKKDWLLRGDVTPGSVASFVPVDGEVFVSGDYESASDNLNIELSGLMIRCIRKSSLYVPGSVWNAAYASLRNDFPDGRTQQTGQMMGSLLCFPLLCLANYLTFKFSVRRPVPVLINGDDIVFRCRTNEKDEWVKNVGSSGLVLSVGKTMVHRSVFSLNSTYFVSSKSSGVSFAPLIRPKCLFGNVEDAGEVAGRLAGCVTGNGRFREVVQSFLLREIAGGVFSTQRSLRRGIGAKVSTRVIRWSRLDLREEFYLSLHSEPSVPLRKKLWMHNSIPDGYTKCAGFSEDSETFQSDMVETCWTRGPISGEGMTSDAYWSYVREGTYRYVPFTASRFWRVAGGGELPRSRLQCPRSQVKVWRKQREGDVAFVSAGYAQD